jgi:tetratricopeptide (TPR) repeat protein
MSLALLASLAAFIRHVERARKRWAALCFISCALGMGAKEVMVVAPLAIWLLDGGLMAGGFRAAWRQRSHLHLALASTWLIPGWLAWNSHLATRGIGFGQGIGLLDYIAVETQAVLHYLRLCVWPERLVFDHGWVRAPGFAGVPVEVGICLVLLGVTAVMLWRRAAAGLAAAWWWLLLAPTSSIIPIVQQPIAESRAYLASAGVVTLLVTLAVRWLRPATKPLLAGLVAVLLALGIRTHLRLSVYRSEIVLWEDTVARQPENARAQAQLGAALLRANRPQESAAASRAAVRLRPDFADALANLGAALLQTGEFVAASETLERTLHLSPEHLVARYNFGLARAKLGDAAGAIAAFRGVLKRQPQHAEAHINLAALLPNVGQPTEAEEHARSAVSLAPQSAEAHYNLGNALARRGDGASAMAAFETALRLQPTMAKAHNNLGVLLLRAGDRRAARRHFEDALRHQPDYPEARRNLAAVSRD